MNLTIIRKLLFIIIIIISCLSNLNRPDFNLALFTFSYLLWDHPSPHHRVRLSYLIIFTFLIDLIWLIYWADYWNQAIFDQYWTSGINTFTIILNSMNLFLKLSVIVILLLQDQSIRYACLPVGLYENIKSVFVHQPPKDSAQYYY